MGGDSHCNIFSCCHKFIVSLSVLDQCVTSFHSSDIIYVMILICVEFAIYLKYCIILDAKLDINNFLFYYKASAFDTIQFVA